MTMTLGERIKTARKNVKLSQKELAASVGVTQQAIAQYETDRMHPSTATLRRIAGALDNPDLLNLDWDLEQNRKPPVDTREESFKSFMTEHGAFVSPKEDVNGNLINYRISIDGEIYDIPVEVWKDAHEHLYAVCKEFVKAMGQMNHN